MSAIFSWNEFPYAMVLTQSSLFYFDRNLGKETSEAGRQETGTNVCKSKISYWHLPAPFSA